MLLDSLEMRQPFGAFAGGLLLDPIFSPVPQTAEASSGSLNDARKGEGSHTDRFKHSGTAAPSDVSPALSGAEERARAFAIEVELQMRVAAQNGPQTGTVEMLGDEAELEGAAAVGVVAAAYAENSGSSSAATSR